MDWKIVSEVREKRRGNRRVRIIFSQNKNENRYTIDVKDKDDPIERILTSHNTLVEAMSAGEDVLRGG